MEYQLPLFKTHCTKHFVSPSVPQNYPGRYHYTYCTAEEAEVQRTHYLNFKITWCGTVINSKICILGLCCSF